MDDSLAQDHDGQVMIRPPTPIDFNAVPRRRILSVATAWNSPLTPTDIPRSQDIDVGNDSGRLGRIESLSIPGLSGNAEALKHSSNDLSPSSARSHSSFDLHELPDGGVSVTTAADRGYTAAEDRYRANSLSRPDPNASLYPERRDTSLSPSNTSIHQSPTEENSGGFLTGVGASFQGLDSLEDLTLNQLLRNSLEKSGGPRAPKDERWLPFDKLLDLVNESNVYRELTRAIPVESQDTTLQDYAKKICQSVAYKDAHGDPLKTSCRSIFAILVLMRQVEAAPSFIDAGISDKHLPLKRVEGELQNNELYSPLYPDHRWDVAHDWEEDKFDLFFMYQNYMLSPFFKIATKEVFLYDLDPNAVLPFIEVGEKQRQGHHGSVWQVKIHPAHHDAPSTDDLENPDFAVKQLNPRDQGRIDFKNEVNAWKKSIGDKKHPHLISLLATWHQDNCFYLLSPWADGNLRDYWSMNKSPKHDHSLVLWMAEQCLGIAEGLKRIHRSDSDEVDEFGIHADIKPENILWFMRSGEEYGTLVICDFGFTRYHNRESRSNALPVGVSRTYCAPEIETSRSISRAYDVWTLGCLYLEFITWYMTGWDGVQNVFATRRIKGDAPNESEEIPTDKFFNCTDLDSSGQRKSPGAVVKPTVLRWIRYLHSQNRCSRYFHELLNFIERDCLVVDRKHRVSCGEVVQTLKDLHKKCKNGREYCFHGLPKPMTRELSPIERSFPGEADPINSVHFNRRGLFHAIQNTYMVASGSTTGHDDIYGVLVPAGIKDILATDQARLSPSSSPSKRMEPQLICAESTEETPLLPPRSKRPHRLSLSSLTSDRLSRKPENLDRGAAREPIEEGPDRSIAKNTAVNPEMQAEVDTAGLDATPAVMRSPTSDEETSNAGCFQSANRYWIDWSSPWAAWSYLKGSSQHWCCCLTIRRRQQTENATESAP